MPGLSCEKRNDEAIPSKNEIATPFRLAMTPFAVSNANYFMSSVITPAGGIRKLKA